MSKEIMENMIPTGLPPLDEIMKGWHLSDLIVISSRYRRGGRTMLAMTIARNLTIDYRIPVAYFSLKLSNVQFVNRLLAMESGCALSELNNYKEDQELAKRIDAAADKLIDIPLNECPHVTKLAKFKQPTCPTGMFWNTLCRI